MTGKEALERLRDSFTPYDEGYIPDEDDEALNVIEKELKALEIIKNKEVNVYDFKEYESKYEYNKHTKEEFQELIQEEYDLLKEVFFEDE